jgi:hypothetical protein
MEEMCIMSHKANRIAVVAIPTILAAVAMAAVNSTASRSTAQSCTTVLDTEVCTWVVTENAKVIELGATIPMALVESVPADAEMVWPPQELGAVPFPAAAREDLGVDHLGLNWEAHGHPPATFSTPHFDFHFYNVDQEAIGAIDCSDLTKPAGLPAGYVLPDIEIPDMGTLVGLCVPLMGMHSMPEHDVSETEVFGATMIVGYYGGNPIFFEPMVSQKLLLKRKDFALKMPTVENLPEGVHYPREARAEFDADLDQYRFVMSGFVGNDLSDE